MSVGAVWPQASSLAASPPTGRFWPSASHGRSLFVRVPPLTAEMAMAMTRPRLGPRRRWEDQLCSCVFLGRTAKGANRTVIRNPARAMKVSTRANMFTYLVQGCAGCGSSAAEVLDQDVVDAMHSLMTDSGRPYVRSFRPCESPHQEDGRQRVHGDLPVPAQNARLGGSTPSRSATPPCVAATSLHEPSGRRRQRRGSRQSCESSDQGHVARAGRRAPSWR